MNKIMTKIKFIYTALSMLIVVIISISIYLNHQNKQDGYVINIAGKERMLTQKASKEIFHAITNPSYSFLELESTLREFSHNLHDLRFGNIERGIYKAPNETIKKGLEQISFQFREFEKRVESMKNYISQYWNYRQEALEYDRQIESQLNRLLKDRVRKDEIIRISSMKFHLKQLTNTLFQLNLESNIRAYSRFYASLKSFKNLLKSSDGSVAPLWDKYTTSATKYFNNSVNLHNNRSYIYKFNSFLLENIDLIVTQYTIYAQSKREFFHNIQLLSSAVAFMLMIFALYLVFKINQNFKNFLDSSKELSNYATPERDSENEDNCYKNVDELDTASSHINAFVYRVNTVITHAKEAIIESENAAKELGSMSEEMGDGLSELSDKKEIESYVDSSENIAIQSLEELHNTSKLLEKLQNNLKAIMEHTTQNRKRENIDNS